MQSTRILSALIFGAGLSFGLSAQAAVNVVWTDWTAAATDINNCATCLHTDSDNTLVSRKGHGLIQFHGGFDQISWTSPDQEDRDGITLGGSPVPETETYAMLIAGLLGVSMSRRKTAFGLR